MVPRINLCTRRDKRSVSLPGRFTPGRKGPAAHWIGGWADPRAGLDAAAKRIIPAPIENPSPVVQAVALSLY